MTGNRTIGVDIGGTKIAAGVVAEDGRILDSTTRRTPAESPDLIEEAVVSAVAELRRVHDVSAVGIGAAGFVDSDRRTVVFAPNLAWRRRTLADRVESAAGIPVVVENDANVAGWAEFRFGAARHASSMLMLTVGTGLGGAVVADGRLLRGVGGFAAEPGHMTVVPEGQWCGCGLRGCLEQYCSGTALVRAARNRAKGLDAQMEGILGRVGGDIGAIDGPLITAAALDGDPGAVDLLEDLGTWLGRGAAAVAAIIDPEVIVVGGGVSSAGDLLLEPARRAFAAHLAARPHRPLARILPAERGNDAGMIGAADLAR